MGQRQTKQRPIKTSGDMEGGRKSSAISRVAFPPVKGEAQRSLITLTSHETCESSTTQYSMKQTITTTERVIVNGQVVKNVVNTREATDTNNAGIDFSKYETFQSQPPRSAFSLTNTPTTSYKPIYERNLSGDGMPVYRSTVKPIPSSSTASVLSKWNPPTNISPIRKNSVPEPKPYTPTYPQRPSLPTSTVENLVINVKKNKRIHDGATKVPTYSTHSKSRGSLFIINNIQFEKKNMYREGAEVDEKNIKALFKQMGFKVDGKNNLKADKMKETLKVYSKSSYLKTVDISVIVLMSHGYGNKTGTTVIAGIDDKELHMSDIVEIFNNINCPNLINKPKIFIFQCCRGDAHQQRIETDAMPFQYNQHKEMSDILLAFSTIPGYVSFRDKCFGTLYIRAICEIFMEFACDYHVEDLLKMVEDKLNQLSKNSGSGQTSSYENWGFKRCYLHP